MGPKEVYLIKGDNKRLKELLIKGFILALRDEMNPDEFRVVDVSFGDTLKRKDYPTEKVLVINYEYPPVSDRHGRVPHLYGDLCYTQILDVGTEHR